MARLTVGFGILLMLVGVIGYLATGHSHITALIPAFLGLPISVLGAVALDEHRRKHAMHGAAGLALLGLLGSMRGVFKLPALLSGAAVERPVAVADQVLTALLCAIFVGLCVKSFMDARRGAV